MVGVSIVRSSRKVQQTIPTTGEHRDAVGSRAIAVADLAPVNLGSVAPVTVGVGQPGGSPSAAKGTVFIDLLAVGTPYSE